MLDRNSKLQKAVSFTTRPIRPNETEGRQYYFTNKKTFKILEAKGKILTSRYYNTYENGKRSIWHYGLPKSEVFDKEYSVAILDHEAVKRVIRKLGKEKVKVVYLYAEESELYKRSAQRKDEHKEFVRRLEDDKKQFVGIEESADLMLRTDTDEHSENLMKIESLLFEEVE
ncbi:MAG: hypothetical protein ACOCRO_07830 [Halanaerobiales bacterium]